MGLGNEENWRSIGGFAIHYFALCQPLLNIFVQLVQLVCRHWVHRTPHGFCPCLMIDGMIEGLFMCQHFRFFLFKKLLVLPVLFWQGL